MFFLLILWSRLIVICWFVLIKFRCSKSVLRFRFCKVVSWVELQLGLSFFFIIFEHKIKICVVKKFVSVKPADVFIPFQLIKLWSWSFYLETMFSPLTQSVHVFGIIFCFFAASEQTNSYYKCKQKFISNLYEFCGQPTAQVRNVIVLLNL